MTRLPDAEVRRLARSFDRSHVVLLPQFLDPAMLRMVQSQVRATSFRVSKHPGFGRDLRMKASPAVLTLSFLINDRRLFSAIERITRCGRIGSLTGAVRRALPGSGNNLGWHDDDQYQRQVAITVNLGSTPYQGGVLQIRNRKSREMLVEVSNTGPGDAVLMRIADNLEHRNTVVRGRIPKTAFSGWFARAPDFEHQLEAHMAQQKSGSANSSTGATRERPPAAAPSDARVHPPDHIAWRRAGDDSILFNLKSGACYRLDVVGAEIWNLLAAGRTPHQAARTVASRYRAPADDVERDVQMLVARLRASRLLEVH